MHVASEFYDLDVRVQPGVLIPRANFGLLIIAALASIPQPSL